MTSTTSTFVEIWTTPTASMVDIAGGFAAVALWPPMTGEHATSFARTMTAIRPDVAAVLVDFARMERPRRLDYLASLRRAVVAQIDAALADCRGGTVYACDGDTFLTIRDGEVTTTRSSVDATDCGDGPWRAPYRDAAAVRFYPITRFVARARQVACDRAALRAIDEAFAAVERDRDDAEAAGRAA